MLPQSTDDWALRLHSCRALSSQPQGHSTQKKSFFATFPLTNHIPVLCGIAANSLGARRHGFDRNNLAFRSDHLCPDQRKGPDMSAHVQKRHPRRKECLQLPQQAFIRMRAVKQQGSIVRVRQGDSQIPPPIIEDNRSAGSELPRRLSGDSPGPSSPSPGATAAPASVSSRSGKWAAVTSSSVFTCGSRNTSAEGITGNLSNPPKQACAHKFLLLQHFRELEAARRKQPLDFRELHAPFVPFHQDRIHLLEEWLLNPEEIHF